MIEHHLFWEKLGIYIGFYGIYLSKSIRIIGKVCVSIFLMLSGIGLYKTTPKYISLKQFYKTRVHKLCINYIFIVITSIIISFLIFYDKFILIIGGGIKALLKIVVTLTGFQYLFGYQFINASWWFFTLILILYICFPMLNKLIEKLGYNIIIFSLLLSFIQLIDLKNIRIFELLS